MNKTFNAFHNLWLAYYYRSKGFSIAAELESLCSAYGPHTHLTSYFKAVVQDFNQLSTRSRTCLYNKWMDTFGEDLTLTYGQLKTLHRQLHQVAPKEPSFDPFTVYEQPVIPPSPCLSTASTIPFQAPTTPAASGCSSESCSAIRTEVASLVERIEDHPYYSAIPQAVLEQLSDVKDLVSGCHAALEFIRSGQSIEPPKVADPIIVAYAADIKVPPQQEYPTPYQAELDSLEDELNEFDDDDHPSDFLPPVVPSTEPITLMYNIDLEKEYEPLTIIVENVNMTPVPVPSAPRLRPVPAPVLDVPFFKNTPLETIIEEDEPLNVEIVEYRYPTPEQERINRTHLDSIGRSIRWSVHVQHMKYADEPMVLPTVAVELERIYITTNILETLVGKLKPEPSTFKKQLDHQLGLNDEVEFGPYNVSSPYDTRSCINPTSPPPPFRLPQPFVTTPPPQNTQNNLVPAIIKAAAEPVLEKKLGRNKKTRLSNRLHWPCDPDDRKGMYIHMLLHYTPFGTDIMWLVYSFTVPESIDAKYWRGKYDYWKVEMSRIEMDCAYHYPGNYRYWPDVMYDGFQRAMRQHNETTRKVQLKMAKEWRTLKKEIIDEDKIRRLEELEAFVAKYKQVVADFRRKYKIIYKRRATLRAAAEPVLEGKDPTHPPDPVMVGKDKLVLGNMEQYMDENGLSSEDFDGEEDQLALVGGMRSFMPNVSATKKKKVRRVVAPPPPTNIATGLEDFTTSITGLPSTYTGQLTPLERPIESIRGLTSLDFRRIEATRSRINQMRRRRLIKPTTRPASAEDQIRPLSPEPEEQRAPSPSLSPPPWSVAAFLRRQPPQRPLPALPLPPPPEEEEEEFNPFLSYPGEEVESIQRVPAPPRLGPIIEDPSGLFQASELMEIGEGEDFVSGYAQGDVYSDPEDAIEDEYRGRDSGWTVNLGKGVGKPVTYVDDPVTGRYVVPPKGIIGRPPKYGPHLPPQPRGRPKQVPAKVMRTGWKVNALGQLVQTQIEETTITRAQFQKKARLLERGVQEMVRRRRTKPSTRVYNRAIDLNIPGLSDQLTEVYKRTSRIRKGMKLTFFGFKINKMKRVGYIAGKEEEFQSLVLHGPLRMFQLQTQHLENFIRTSVNRAINMWRIVIIYTNQTGEHITSTTWAGDYMRCYNQALNKIVELVARYGEENVVIERFDVRVRVARGQQLLVGGKNAIDDKLKGLEKEYTVINPRSKTNCLWTSVAISTGYNANPDLIFNPKTQNEAGKNLKRKVGTRNYKGGTTEDLQKLSNYKHVTIQVVDFQGEQVAEFQPKQPVGNNHIKLMLHMGHYHSLLANSDQVVMNHKTQIREDEPRRLQPIKILNKSFEGRRIVTYDLESYRNPKYQPTGELMEVDQVAYAIGWSIQTANIGEMATMAQEGYEIEEADIKYGDVTEKIFMAYKRLLGEDCLNQALEEWLHNPIYDNAVFYAHNGGKFDIRLILGQSNLLYQDKYVIVPDKLVELNGRLINLDVENQFKEYETNYDPEKEKSKKHFHHISIRDSLPLFGPESRLAKLTTELDVPHKKMEELINVHELQNADTWEQNWYKYKMDAYLKCDVLGLLEVLLKFDKEVTEEIEIPITCVNTGASLAKKYYLKHHYHNTDNNGTLDPSTSIYSLDRDMDTFIREGYGGGRCENFKCGLIKDKVYYYDFTSLYPDVGRLPMPIGQPKWMIDPSTLGEETSDEMIKGIWKERMVNRNIFGNTAYWKVRVRSPLAAQGNMTDPLHRKPLFGLKEEGMYVFRWFKEWTEMVIYEEEIKFAMDQQLDYEFEPINGIIFQHQEVLKSCMEDLFKKKAKAKEDGKPGLSKTWKIIINSLYGVWGLKVLDREGIEIARPEHSNWAIDLATEKLIDVEKVGRYVISRRMRDLEVKDCNVALAAAVTSEARMKLYKLIMDIQDTGKEVLYCDTDSIITTHCLETDPVLKAKWMGDSMGKDLGSLKNEIEECYEKLNKKGKVAAMKPYFDQCIIVAPKLYMVTAEGGKIIKKAHKGYREDEAKGDIVTYNRMKTLVDMDLKEEERTLEQDTDQWLGGNADIMKNNIGVRIVRRHRVIQGICSDGHPINKGILGADGNIQPFVVRTDRRKRKNKKKKLII